MHGEEAQSTPIRSRPIQGVRVWSQGFTICKRAAVLDAKLSTFKINQAKVGNLEAHCEEFGWMLAKSYNNVNTIKFQVTSAKNIFLMDED